MGAVMPGCCATPGQRDPRIRDAPLARYLGNAVHHVEVGWLAIDAVAVIVGPRADGGPRIFAAAVAHDEAARQWAPGDYADALLAAQWQHLALLLAVDHVVVVLHRGETRDAHVVSPVEHLGELPGGHGTRPDIQGFAAPDHVVECFQRFLDGRTTVEAVDLIEVHVIHAEAFQAVIDGVEDVLAGKAALVGIVAHAVVDLGGDDNAIARRAEIPQGPAE